MNILEELQKLNEVRAEDNLYFQGAFWIKADSLKDTISDKFTLLIGSKILSDYYGDFQQETASKNQLSHIKLWNNVSDGREWNYYPRGRVAIDQGTAYIHLNSACNTDAIINAIIDEYQIKELRIVMDFNHEYQGSHYDFLLR